MNCKSPLNNFLALLTLILITHPGFAQEVSIVELAGPDVGINTVGVRPAIDDGVVAFLGVDIGSGTQGIYTMPADASGPAVIVADESTPIPDMQSILFNSFSNPDIHGGNVAFNAAGGPGTGGIFLSDSSGQLTRLVDAGGSLSLSAEGVSWAIFGTSPPNQSDTFGRTLFKPFGQPHFTLLQPGDPLPGGGIFADIRNQEPSNKNGVIALPVDTSIENGVYVYDIATGTFNLIVNGTEIPDHPGDVFRVVRAADCDGQTVAFTAFSGTFCFGCDPVIGGVYTANIDSAPDEPSVVTKVVELGDPAPGQPGATYYSLSDVAIDGDLLVFEGSVDNVTGPNEIAIFGKIADGPVFRIYTVGDPINGFAPSEIQWHFTGLSNNQIVFRGYIGPPPNGGLLRYALYSATILGIGETAELNRASPATGTVLGGGLRELKNSDDSYLHTRSGYGFSFLDLHHMELFVAASSGVSNPTVIDINIESRIDFPIGGGVVALRNWKTGKMDFVGSFAVGMTDQLAMLQGINATHYVDGSGQIELSVKHRVFIPRFIFQFESFVDKIEIVTR